MARIRNPFRFFFPRAKSCDQFVLVSRCMGRLSVQAFHYRSRDSYTIFCKDSDMVQGDCRYCELRWRYLELTLVWQDKPKK